MTAAEARAIAETVPCPLCKAPKGEACRNVFGGTPPQWPHQSRGFAARTHGQGGG